MNYWDRLRGFGRKASVKAAVRHRVPRFEILEQRQLLAANIVEFPLPVPDARPLEITSGNDGNLWFGLDASGQIGMMDTVTYAISVVDIPGSTTPVHFGGLVPGPGYSVWFDSYVSENGVTTRQVLGSVDLKTHAITTVPIPATTSRLGNLVMNPSDGTFFVPEVDNGSILSYNPTTQVFQTTSVINSGGTLGRIELLSNGSLLFTQTNPDELGLYSPQFALNPVLLSPGSQPADSIEGPGNISLFTEPGLNKIGVYDSFLASVFDYSVPTTGAGLGPISAGPSGHFFAGERKANQIADFDLQNRSVVEYPLPSPQAGIGGEVRGDDGNLWFTEPGHNAVAVLSFVPIAIPTITKAATAGKAVPVGEQVTLTATVTPTGGVITPTGLVDFVDPTNNVDLGTAPLVNGVATLSTTSLGLGFHTLDANYRGDFTDSPNFSPSFAEIGQNVISASLTPTVTTLSSQSVAGTSSTTASPQSSPRVEGMAHRPAP